MPETQLYIYQLLPDGKQLIDSVKTDESGNFTVSFSVKSAGYYSLRIDAKNEITLVVSPTEHISLNGDGKSLQNTYTVEGSNDSKLYKEYSTFTTANLAKVDSLSRIFTDSRSNSDFVLIKNRLDSAYLEIYNHQKEQVITFVNSHLNSLTSLLVISDNFGPNPVLSGQTNPELFLKLDSALVISYLNSSHVNAFHLRMNALKSEIADWKLHDSILKPGMPAPDISLPNSNGKQINLSSCKGKLTLVYFWSSWNALCRQTSMNLTSIYSKYKDRGFEIYAISIDTDVELWTNAYRLDKAYWIQVNDLKGLESSYCKTYGAKAIPKFVLVGKNGNIISNQPEFAALEALIKRNL